MSCRVITESWISRKIRVLNRLHDLRDPSQFIVGGRELLPYGRTLGLESEHLREAVWPRSCGWRMSLDRRWEALELPGAGIYSCHWTHVVILIGVKFWPLHILLCFHTCQSMQMGSGKAESIRRNLLSSSLEPRIDNRLNIFVHLLWIFRIDGDYTPRTANYCLVT